MGGRARYVECSEDSYGSYAPPVKQVYTHLQRPATEERYSDSSGTSDSKNSCLPWVKYGIFACNVVFLVVGTTIMTMGAWLRTDSRFRDFLSERYRQAVHEAFWEAPTLYAFSYVLIILGAFMCVVAFCGCCGATSNARVFLIVYSLAVFVLLVATLTCGIYIFYKKDGINVELSDALNYMVQHYYQGPSIVQESLDRLQQTFRCCGNAGCSDFRVFRQDPPRSCDIRCDGCHYRIWHALSIGFAATLVVFFFVILGEVLAIALSLYLIFRPDEQVRVVYYRPDVRPVEHSLTSPPSLTRENLERHNMPYALRKDRRRKYF